MKKRERKPPKLNSTTREGVGGRLFEALEARQLSQADVGAECGVSRQAVNHWCQGRAMPELAQLYAVCRDHKISADFLLFGPSPEQADVVAIIDRVSQMTPDERRALLTILPAPRAR